MKNIIFDVDGTLWDTTEVITEAWNRAIAEVGGTSAHITPDVLKREFGKPMDKIADNVFFDANQQTREALLVKCCEYEHEALEKNTENLLFPEVKETLEKLSKTCRLFIVSNCQSGYIELFMKKAGVESCITDHECFGDTGMQKGDNIKLVIERNKLKDAVYVGDTQGDYESTVYAGIPFIFAKYGFGKVEAHEHEISEFNELLSLYQGA